MFAKLYGYKWAQVLFTKVNDNELVMRVGRKWVDAEATIPFKNNEIRDQYFDAVDEVSFINIVENLLWDFDPLFTD